MAQPVSTPHQTPATQHAEREAPPQLTLAAIGLAGLALFATLALWFHYGTAVFFETIAAGVAGCF
jgi:hypothetical protein